VKHIPAVLMVLVLSAAAIACGDDNPQPQIGGGPADNIEGTWQGTYIAADGSQGGSLCLVFEQDGRGITGRISFDQGEFTSIGGVITENTLALAYGAGLESPIDTNIPADIAAGGTLTGTTNEDASGMSGTWIAAASLDVHGDWTAAKLSQFDDCR
jgi:hypothetical protein